MVGSVYQSVIGPDGVLSFEVTGDDGPGAAVAVFRFGGNMVRIDGGPFSMSARAAVTELDLPALARGSTVSVVGAGFGSSAVATIVTGDADMDIPVAGSEADGEIGWTVLGGERDNVFRMSNDTARSGFSGPYSPSVAEVSAIRRHAIG